jgi:ketopantoate reductase
MSGRKRSEVLYLNGAVASHGQRLGLDVPVNSLLCETLMGIVSGQVPWETFRHRPQQFLEAVG